MIQTAISTLFTLYWYFNYVSEVRSADALLYSLKHFTRTLDIKETPCLTACPATYKREKKFNEEVSISGKSLFLRQFYQSNEPPELIELNICNTSYEPVIIYNSKRDNYQIGYELYYYEKKDQEIHSAYQNYYDQFRSANVTLNIRDKITHSTKPPNDFFVKFVDSPNTKFNLADGTHTLGFHWIPVLSIDYSRYKKRVSLAYNAHLNDDIQLDLNGTIPTCDDFNFKDEDTTDLFSEKNQEKCLKNILTETSDEDTSFQNMSCGQSYGCLEKSQVVPLWYFRSRSTQLASCMHMNMVPIWKTIAEGQLRKVDQYILTILHTWRRLRGLKLFMRRFQLEVNFLGENSGIQHESNYQLYYSPQDLNLDNEPVFGDIIYGTWNALKLPTTSKPNQPQEIYLSNTEHNQAVIIPKIIYRIVTVWWHGVAIIIHNDLSHTSDEDRFCTKETHVKGWESISNEDWTTGLTYACPLTKELDYKLGIDVFNPDLYHSELHGSPEESRILRKSYKEICI